MPLNAIVGACSVSVRSQIAAIVSAIDYYDAKKNLSLSPPPLAFQSFHPKEF